MQRKKNRTLTISIIILVILALAYYVAMPLWLRQKSDMLLESMDDVSIEIGQISSAIVPVGFHLKSVRIRQEKIGVTHVDAVTIDRISVRGLDCFPCFFEKNMVLPA